MKKRKPFFNKKRKPFFNKKIKRLSLLKKVTQNTSISTGKLKMSDEFLTFKRSTLRTRIVSLRLGISPRYFVFGFRMTLIMNRPFGYTVI